MLTLYEKKDKLAIHKEYGNLTMPMVLKKANEMKSIYVHYKENPEDLLRMLKLMMIDLCKSVNVSKNMTPDQIEETAILILDTYKSLKLEEVFIVIADIKKGRRVKINERLDGLIVLSAFESYFNDRLNESDRIQQQLHQQNKSGYSSEMGQRTSESKNIKNILVTPEVANSMIAQQTEFVNKKDKK